MIIDNNMIAEMCHTVNKTWCEINGDDSQPSWDDAPDWQKQSALNGVVFHQLNPSAGDSASHDNWVREKLEAGWTYGKFKDPEKKTHYCLVPFEELPLAQQKKDALFRAIVHALSTDK